MDRNIGLEAVRLTEAAAMASARVMGRGDEKLADQVAVDAMRKAFNQLNIRGTVVIGEGERDEAPMLYIGEKVGKGDAGDPEVDIALDPREGTTITATGGPSALSVIAMADKGNLLAAPDTYMDKIAVGPSARGAIDLTKGPSQNLRAIADKKGVYLEDLTVIILNRPRHEKLIAEVRASGARIKLIGDGDVSAAIATCFVETGVDVLMGIGGAPEGVIAAAAVRCCGGDPPGLRLSAAGVTMKDDGEGAPQHRRGGAARAVLRGGARLRALPRVPARGEGGVGRSADRRLGRGPVPPRRAHQADRVHPAARGERALAHRVAAGARRPDEAGRGTLDPGRVAVRRHDREGRDAAGA